MFLRLFVSNLRANSTNSSSLKLSAELPPSLRVSQLANRAIATPLLHRDQHRWYLRPSAPPRAPFLLPVAVRMALLAVPQILTRLSGILLIQRRKEVKKLEKLAEEELKKKQEQLQQSGKVVFSNADAGSSANSKSASTTSFSSSSTAASTSDSFYYDDLSSSFKKEKDKLNDDEKKDKDGEDAKDGKKDADSKDAFFAPEKNIRRIGFIHRLSLWLSGACVVVIIFDSVEKVPYTGRWHLALLTPEMEQYTQQSTLEEILFEHGMTVSKEEMKQMEHSGDEKSKNKPATSADKKKSDPASNQDDAKKQEEAKEAVKKPAPIRPFDSQMKATVQRVFDKLIANIDPQVMKVRPDVKFELHFLDSSEFNACALPAGAVCVHSDLLPVVQTEGALAFILAHELSHVIARHGSEKMAGLYFVELLTGFVRFAALGIGWQLFQLFPLINSTQQYFVELPHSRLLESEADHIGLMLMVKAGYHPSEAALSLSRLENVVKAMHEATGQPMAKEWFNTHPVHETRVASIEKYIPELLPSHLPTPKAVSEALQRSQQPLVSRWGQMMFNRELKHRLEFLKQQREAEEARKKKELEQKAAKEAEEKLKQKEAHAKTKK